MTNRKKEIIEAVLLLAAEKGLGTISMQQIADKVGITKASLYNHFSSKEEIVNEMYEVLRTASKKTADVGEIDYDKLAEGRSLKEILTDLVTSYKRMVNDPKMYLFYKIIMSERSINSAAAEIMVKETKKMINATKTLFYALQVKGIADFKDVDVAAFSFAMAVHAIIDYEFDMRFAGQEAKEGRLQDYIDEFCRIYDVKNKGKE